MNIEVKPSLTTGETHSAWDLYSEVFADINLLAAQRHLMSWFEFDEMCAEPVIQKHLAYDGDDLIGMSVITNELRAWPLISPEFFAHRFPQQYKHKAIWYVGFVGCRPVGRAVHAFSELIRSMWPQVMDSHGLAVMDYCAYNVAMNRLPERSLKVQQRLNPLVVMERIDSQGFYAFDHGNDHEWA